MSKTTYWHPRHYRVVFVHRPQHSPLRNEGVTGSMKRDMKCQRMSTFKFGLLRVTSIRMFSNTAIYISLIFCSVCTLWHLSPARLEVWLCERFRLYLIIVAIFDQAADMAIFCRSQLLLRLAEDATCHLSRDKCHNCLHKQIKQAVLLWHGRQCISNSDRNRHCIL